MILKPYTDWNKKQASKAWPLYALMLGLIGLLLALMLCGCNSACAQSPASLHVEQRGGDTLLYVTGGTSNVQYQIWTSPDNKVDSTNWYYWRRTYSTNYSPYAEILINGTNTTYRPQRFFQIRGILPD